MRHLKTDEDLKTETRRVYPLRPIGAVAAMIAKRVSANSAPLIYVAETGRRRRDIHTLASILAGPGSVCAFETPDGFPGDGLPVTAAIAGNRMAMLRWLLDQEKRPSVLIATPSALIRKVPPRKIWDGLHQEITVGETLDEETLKSDLERLGYWLDDRVDEPGEAAFRGKVLEIFPAAAPRPCRIEHEDGVVTAIRSYDPISQRSVAESDCLIIDPASEMVHGRKAMADRRDGDETQAQDPSNGRERFLSRHYDACETIFDYLPDADIVLESGADIRADEFFEALTRIDGEASHGHAALADHIERDDWDRTVKGRAMALVDEVATDFSVPHFALERQPYKSFAAFADPLIAKGYRLVLAGAAGRRLRSAVRKAGKALDKGFADVADWNAVLDGKASSLMVLDAPIIEGFIAPDDDIVVVSLHDLEGQQAVSSASTRTEGFEPLVETFVTGDKVVHIDHGVAVLDGLVPLPSNVSDGDGDHDTIAEALVLRYQNDETLLVPMSDIGAVWRYGGASSEVKLDRLKGKSWAKRRDKIFAAVATTAEGMVERLKEKAEARAAKIVPDRLSFERFCSRFAYDLTSDQDRATAEVMGDLASGRPMDRLVCGDVGYGKTEVALRAAAAAVFAGKQVAVFAPTTILAQQHYRQFVDRFSPQGVEVVRLSRLVDKDEASAAIQALNSGKAKILVGTHAILSGEIDYDDLALVVVDEEQRFGSEHKKQMRSLKEGAHVLSMTATPIPRTLQAGFVGLTDLSIIATPPSRRSPVKTQTGSFDDEIIREALAAERSRNGQSFVVCPRIEDLEPMAEKLKALVPDQTIVTLHGRMKPDAVEDAMLAFANGDGDILLATAIIESGLDVANANTMIVCHADRFGLAELHQLRGRVGRGARRGEVLLTTQEEAEIGEDARKRLAALEEFNRLGSGFDIAARDLDLRGTGELLGDEQAGHIQTIGIGLYRKMLERAIALARGEPAQNDLRPSIAIGLSPAIPADYVPEPDMRIELALLLERVEEAASLKELRDEIEDRFGPMPDALQIDFELADLRLRCRDLGVTKLDSGPKATALSLTPQITKVFEASKRARSESDVKWAKNRLIFASEGADISDPINHAHAVLDRLAKLLP